MGASLSPQVIGTKTISSYRASRVVFALFALIALLIGIWWWIQTLGPSRTGEEKIAASMPPALVEVVKPKAGGLDRVCEQPGSLEPFYSVDLFAKVSGFLVEQSVDIGDTVKSGGVLAKIYVPEIEKQVKHDEASIDLAKAKVRQMEARVTAAKAEQKAAESSVSVAKTNLKAKTAYREYRHKQLVRFRDLNAAHAIEAKLVDEAEDQHAAALEAENAARESIDAAIQREVAAGANIVRAEADLEETKADVAVAAANLEKSKVLLGYTVILSPYDGVITRRTFSPGTLGTSGSFIRSADAGGDRVPLLTVEEIKVMRLVVKVPDRDAALVKVGTPAVIRFDSLPREEFRGEVKRFSRALDDNKLMRTEIDLPNPDGRLTRGMYGRTRLLLASGAADAMRVPTSALLPGAEKPKVRVVREGKIKIVPVTLGADNGHEVEVMSGITATDEVVVKSSVALAEGDAVKVVELGKN